LERGRRVREVLRQDQHDLLPVIEQICILFAATTGLLDGVRVDHIAAAERCIRREVSDNLARLGEAIEAGQPIDDAARAALTQAARTALGRGDLM
jgi:F-type H+-transporting ATPase subunit alpha